MPEPLKLTRVEPRDRDFSAANKLWALRRWQLGLTTAEAMRRLGIDRPITLRDLEAGLYTCDWAEARRRLEGRDA